jgi:hypothetical protein
VLPAINWNQRVVHHWHNVRFSWCRGFLDSVWVKHNFIFLVIRRSHPLKVLDCSGNAMRTKGILELLVAVRDRELRLMNPNVDTLDNVVVSVNKVNVVVTLRDADSINSDSKSSSGATNKEADAAVEMTPTNSFELRVSDNTLTASETAILILTELKSSKGK